MDALDESKEAIRFELLRGIERFHKQVTLSLMVTQRTEAMELDYGDVTCDICRTSPIKIYYRCNICGDGLYDVCLECRNKGRSCLDESHEPLEPNHEVFMEIRLKDPEITAYVKWEIKMSLTQAVRCSDPQLLQIQRHAQDLVGCITNIQVFRTISRTTLLREPMG